MSVVCLVNDSTTVRERGSDGVDVLECGCASTGTRWLQQCREHAGEQETIRVRWKADHDRDAAIRELTS